MTLQNKWYKIQFARLPCSLARCVKTNFMQCALTQRIIHITRRSDNYLFAVPLHRKRQRDGEKNADIEERELL